MSKRDDEAQLTKVASERVTWEAAAAHVNTYASAAFLRKETTMAETLRDIGSAFTANAKRVSAEQDVLLKKMGH